jgi:16S rRNA (cytosine967-C5)-methyltransferase
MDASTFEDKSLPSAYDAVMLDAPCSNTGVIQRRTDVKWEATAKGYQKLRKSYSFSCCTLLPDSSKRVVELLTVPVVSRLAENQLVVDAFLASKSGRVFKLEKSNGQPPLGDRSMMVRVLSFCDVRLKNEADPLR